MLGLRFGKFRKLFIELCHYFRPLPDKVAMQRPCLQGFNGLSDNLIA
jgi:hypothetical protein